MTFRIALRIVFAAVLGTSTLLAAETTYLPGAAELGGLQGARFSSTLELTNPGDAAATATIGLVPMAGKTPPAPVVRTLAAGESVRIEAALKTLFGLADDGAGTITVSSDAALLTSLTTRNVAAAEGPYGLGLFAVPEADLLGAGETGHSIWVSHSADPKTGYRTNLSVTLIDPGTIVVVRVFRADGSPAGETTLSAQTPQVWQKPVTAIAGEASLPVGRAEFEVKAGRATAYAVVNDNVTSDAIALQSERVPAGATERLVSGAALSPGHLGAFWVTDLRIFNPGAEPVVATIRSLGAPTAASAAVAVPAHGVVEVPKVLAFLGLPERTASALRVSADTPLLVAARTNNVDPTGVRTGTFSAQQFVSIWPTGLLGAGSTGYFTGVDQTLNVPGTRTNLALVGGPEGAAGALVLRDERGAEQGRVPFRRAPGEWGQLGVADWFASSLAGTTSRDGLSLATVPPNSRIDVTVDQGALDAYVSQIDNGSGDAVTRPFGLPGGGDCSKVAIVSFEATPLPVKPGVQTTLSWTLAIDPPTAELTSQSIKIGTGPEIELDKNVRSYATSFPEAGPVEVMLKVRKGSCVKTRTLSIAVCGELALEPATLVEATVGEPYAGVSFAAPAGRPPLAFRVSEGALPAGLTLSPSGLLDGTPAEAGVASFTIAVIDANGCTGQRAYRIEVGCPPMSIAPAALPGGTVGTPYPATVLSVSGGSGSGTFAGYGLPPGLAVSSNGRIEGTPTVAGRFDTEIVYRDANGCSITIARTIVVCNPIAVEATLPAATAGVAITPTPFTVSGAVGATTFAVTAGALPTGTSFDGATGILSGTPIVVGTFPFTVTATDSLGCTGILATSLTVSCPTITVSPASLANATAGVAYGPVTLTQTGGVGTATYAVTTGALPAGLTLTGAGVLSGTPTVTGTFNFTVTATDANSCTGTRAYTLVVECPTITVSPASLGNGTAGVAYGPVTVTQAGGVGTATYAVTAGALPTGVTLSSAGVLSGTPTVTGTFNFTVTATDANGCTGTRALTLVIDCPVITVSPAGLANATAGAAYGPMTLTETGGVGTVTYAVTAGALPAGITLTTAGVLSGTPTVTGTFDFTVTATDANGCTGTRAYTLVVECPVITVSPATLPGGTTGIAYVQSVGSTGGLGTMAYAVTTGALPPGLVLDGVSGAITGTPTAAGTYSFTVTATDGNGCTGSRAYTVGIVCPTITVGPGALTNGTVGTAYSQTVLGAGGGGAYLYAVTAGTLPAGLSLDGASGAITGTPTTADLYAFTITATDQYGCSGATAYQVRICPVIEVTPATAAQGTIGQVYAGATFAQTGGVLPVEWSATGLPLGLTLDAATGALTGTPTEAGGFAVVVTATDANGCTGSVAFTLRICPEMAIDAPASLAAGTVGTAYGPVTFTQAGSGATITWSATGLPTGLTLDPATGVLSGTPGEPGSFTVVVTATDANGCAVSRSYPLTITCPTITLSPGTLPGATAATAYSQTITASSALVGGSYSYSVFSGALPAGLTLNPATGEISGTPTAVGSFNVTIRATHDPTGCTGDQAYTLVVACATITVGGGAPPTNVTAGVAGYTHTFTATGGVSPWTFTSTGTLPTGLTLNPTTGVLSGTPTVTGTFNFTIVATDSATGATCSGSAPFSVTVVCPTITVSPASLGNGTAGVAYGPVTLTQAGGVGTATYAVTAGALPAGVTLSSAGVLSGTPTVTGTFNFTVTATDANGCTGTRALTLVIDCPVITVSPAGLANATAGAAYGPMTLTETGGVGTVTYAVTAGALPAGITLTTAGVLSGTPTVTGTFDFTVTATDANGCTGTRAYTLVVECPVITVSPATLPGGTTGIAYVQSVGSTGGLGTMAYAVTTGALPPGLVLDGVSGAITGTPTAAGTYSFTVTATDGNGCTGSRAYTVGIVCPTITVGPGALTNGTVGTAYSQTVLGAGGGGAYLYAVTAGTLPAGLSLDGASGAITGTPTTADLYAFTITATDQYGCSGATAYQVRICPVIEVTPATAAQGTIGQVYAGATFAQTGGVLPVEWSATGLPLGLTLDAATGALTGTPTEAGGFAVVVTATDANGCTGSVAFTLRICPEMAIDAPASLAAGTVGTAYGPVTFTQAGSGATITWSATGLPTGLTLDPATGVLSGTPGEPGSFTVVVTATDANGCAVSRSYPLTITCPTITLSPGTLPGATAATAYSQTITASSALVGGSYSYSVFSGALPAGLTLNPATGEISGTPTAVGSFNVTIRATHDPTGCTGDQAYTLVVACATITVGGGAPPTNVTAGVAGYTHTFTATGGVSPWTFTSTGTLPTGLTLNPTTGVLSGTPTVTGTFNFTIVATDSATGATCSGSAPFSVTVVCPTITVSPATLPGGIVGTAYTETATAAGGTGPYTFAVTAGALPTGLTLGTDGAITGTPSAAGEFTFTITATDTTTSCTGSRAFTVRICPVIGLSAVPTCATVGSTYTTTITPSAGTAPFGFTSTGTLPLGTTLNPTTGVLSGTLTTAGSFPFSITATDANGCTGSQSYTVNVLDMAPAAAALPDATFGTAYSQAVTASGGSGGFTYAVTAGSLPEGISLNAATGALTGTPGGALGTGSFSFTVTATNTATTCTIAKAYTLVSRPVAVQDTYANGAGNTEFYGGGYAPTPATPFVANATNILSNDLGPGLTVTSLTQPANGTVTLGAAGAFRYTPNAGAETSATFTYKVTSNGVESQAAANVTITLVGQVWYVNSSGANGIGTSSSPFNNLANADVASGAGDVVFVHTGAATTTGAITLDANQVLWGQGAAFSLAGSGLSIGAAGKPTLTGTVTLGGSSVLVSSLDIATTGAVGFTDNQAGAITGITVQNGVTVSATNAAAVDLTGVAASASGITFTSLTSSNSTGKGLNLGGIGGTFTSGTTTVTNPAGIGIDVQTSVAGGTISLGTTSATSSGGTGVNLASNAGNVTFGALTVSPDANQRGLLATENTGTLTIASGTVTTTGNTAVEVTKTSGATPLAVTLTAVNANGGPNGIYLSRTSGSFTVAGAGTAGSGGTIRNQAGADGAVAGSGVYLSNVSNVSLSRMQLNDFPNFAIRGIGVSGFSLTNSVVNGANGTNGAIDEAAVAFDGLTGTALVQNSSISGGVEDNFRVRNSSGTLNRITFDATTFGANNAATGNDALLLEPSGTAVLNVTVQNCTFTSAAGDLFQLNLLGSSVSDLVFTGNTLSNNHPAIATGGGGVTITGGDNTTPSGVTLTYNIANNTFRDANGHAVLIVKSTDPGSFTGTFTNNTIGVAGTANSGSVAGSGIKLQTAGLGTFSATVTNNQIRQYNNFGIEMVTGGGAIAMSGNFNAKVTGNTVSNPGTGGLPMNGIHLNGGTVVGDTYAICVDIGGAGALANTINGSGANGGTDVRLRQRMNTTVRLPGYGGANNDNTAVQNYLIGRNVASPTALASNTVGSGGSGFIGGAPCLP